MSANEVLYLQQIAFCQVASAAALAYDYLLTFGKEVDLIWARKWNIVTLLYAIVRYLSFFLIGYNVLYKQLYLGCERLAWYETRTWGLYVFRIAMDIIMMKRLYALSHRPSRFLSSPKWVLATIVTAFIVKTTLSIVMLLMALGPWSQLIVFDPSFSGTRVCCIFIPKANILVSAQIPTLVFELLVFGLSFSYFIADIWGFWRSKDFNLWKVGDLLRIMIRDSTIYFAIVAAATALSFGNLETAETNIYTAMSIALQNFLPFCFAPRLVLNVKEHANRVHMSGVGEELSDMMFNQGHLPQSTDQMDDGGFA